MVFALCLAVQCLHPQYSICFKTGCNRWSEVTRDGLTQLLAMPSLKTVAMYGLYALLRANYDQIRRLSQQGELWLVSCRDWKRVADLLCCLGSVSELASAEQLFATHVFPLRLLLEQVSKSIIAPP